MEDTLAALANGRGGALSMRVALWLMALFAVAVARRLFAGNNAGTVTLFLPPHRVDMSLNSFCCCWRLGF